jgi:hypothetical protein
VQIPKHHLQEDQSENKGNWRYIDTTEIRHNFSDRAQSWLGDPMEKIDDRINKLVGGVDDVKRDQPAQDRPDNDHPDIEVDRDDRDANEGVYNDHNLGSPPDRLRVRRIGPRQLCKS